MGIRFRKRIRLTKGVHLNLSKPGLGISAGVRGARIGTGPRGAYRSLGIPGTGLYMFDRIGTGTASPMTPAGAPADQPFSEKPLTPVVPRDLRISSWMWLLPVAGVLLLGVVPPAGLGLLLGSGAAWAVAVRSGRWRGNRLWHGAVRDLRQARWEEALEKLNRLATTLRDPGDELLRIKGKLERRVGQWPEAVHTYRTLLDGFPADAGVRLELVDALSGSGDHQGALEEAGRLPEEIRDQPFGVLLMARLMMEVGRNEEALHLLKDKMGRKRKMTPELMESRYLMGLLHARLGDQKAALDQLQRVYAQDLHYRDVADRIDEARRRLVGTGDGDNG